MKDIGFGHRRFIDRWKRSFPNAEVTVLPGANHFLQEDAPEEVAAAVRRKFASS